MKLIEALDQLINVSPPKEVVMDKTQLVELTLQAIQKNPFLWPASGFTGGVLNVYRGVKLTVSGKAWESAKKDAEPKQFKNVI